MRYLEEVDMRRLVLTLAIDASHEFCIEGKDPAQTMRATMLFARSRTIPVAVSMLPDGVMVKRVKDWDPQTTRIRRWELDNLARGERLVFTIAPPDHHKLRLAASTKARVTGWTIRCRLQDDGTMLVYRTDSGAEAGSTGHPSDSASTP